MEVPGGYNGIREAGMKKKIDTTILHESEWEMMQRERAARRRRERGSALLICLLLLAAVVLLTIFICILVMGRMRNEGTGEVPETVESGDVSQPEEDASQVLSDSIVYSQEELEAQVENARAQAAAQVLEDIRTGLNSGDSIMQTLRPLYPEDLIVYSGGQYNFVPINRSLKQNGLEEECLNILETGEYQYLQDGQVISHKGIDVSRHQGGIDWSLVAQDGVEFAFLRVGYRGYGTGKLLEDDRFEENIQAALAAGIKVGVYFYSQAVNETEVLEEAQFVLEKIAPYQIDCPVVFDVEKVSGEDARMNRLSKEERTALTVLFCQTIENAGYKPMIYYNTEMGAMMLQLEALEEYDKWFAAYTDDFYYPYAYRIWQYSQTGKVQGIQGNVDLNISFQPLWGE
jgi:lysozyme